MYRPEQARNRNHETKPLQRKARHTMNVPIVFFRGQAPDGPESLFNDVIRFFRRRDPSPVSAIHARAVDAPFINGGTCSGVTVVVLSALLLLGAWTPSPVHAKGVSDRIVAVVNGDVILKSDVSKAKQPIMRNFFQLPLGIVPPGKVPTEREILDELVAIHLLEQEAARKAVNVDERSVLASIDAMRQRNKLTHDQFVVKLAAAGMDYPDFIKVYGRHLKLTKLIQMEVVAKVRVDEKDAEEYFKKNRGRIKEIFRELITGQTPAQQKEEDAKPKIPTEMEVFTGGRIKLRQITLVMPKGGANRRSGMEKLKKTTETVMREAMTGADFGALARKYSKDPSASSGGDIGYMKYKDMVPGVQQLVQHMKEGDIRPVELRDRVMIFYLEDAKGRTVKKVPIPARERRLLEKRFKEEQERRKAQQAAQPQKPAVEANGPETSPKGETSDGTETAKGDGKGKKDEKPSGILTPDEEKAYRKVKNEVMAIVRHDRMEARMKEWIDQLKKDAMIEVKL
jgi:peptidyl-prolyl cis-trans isomerase SurA